MKELTVGNLAKKIIKNVNIEENVLKDELERYIWPRLDFIVGSDENKLYFEFEDSYIETEWKDMISIHYLNTSYNVQNSVMRVHIFAQNTLDNEVYVGFFTLRKIDEVQIMLSFIYPDWRKVKCDEAIPHVMTYLKYVHIKGRVFTICTYPLFAQDNITVACSQANIISMTKYLHSKYDMNMLRIRDINKSFSVGKTKLFPTYGINSQQMLEIFSNNNIPVYIKQIGWKTEEERQREEKIYCRYIDYSIESAIPVMIGGCVKNGNIIEKHVVQIIGHAKQDRHKYIIYDDSGYLIRNIGNQEERTNGFVEAIEWEKLYEFIGQENSFILFALHEKVYLQYDDMRDILEIACNQSTGIQKMINRKYLILDETRYLVVDNIIIKEFLNKLSGDKYILSAEMKDIEETLSKNMPHYLWYCEIPLKNNEGYWIFVADTTFWKKTTKNIFYIKGIYSKRRISLLNYS